MTKEQLQALDRALDTLELSARTLRVLREAGMLWVGEVVKKTRPDLLALSTMGLRSVKELEQALAALGLGLGMSVYWTAPNERKANVDTLGRAVGAVRVLEALAKCVERSEGLADAMDVDFQVWEGDADFADGHCVQTVTLGDLRAFVKVYRTFLATGRLP